jgi:hypothetical protein
VPIANATPMHSAATTTLASVSLPSCSASSQWSNISTTGPPRPMAMIAVMNSRRTTRFRV